MTPTTPPAVSDAMREAVASLPEATYGDLVRACRQTELDNRRLVSEIARLTGERDAAREAQYADNRDANQYARDLITARAAVARLAARAEAAEAKAITLAGERDAALAQWADMAELVCEFAAEKAPDAIALVGTNRDAWRRRALVAADAMTRLQDRAEAAEAETARLRAALEGLMDTANDLAHLSVTEGMVMAGYDYWRRHKQPGLFAGPRAETEWLRDVLNAALAKRPHSTETGK